MPIGARLHGNAFLDAFPRARFEEHIALGVSLDDLTVLDPSKQFRDGKTRYVHKITGEEYYTSNFLTIRGNRAPEKTIYRVSAAKEDPRIPMLALIFGVTFDDLKLSDIQKPDNCVRYIIKATGSQIKCSKAGEWSEDVSV